MKLKALYFLPLLFNTHLLAQETKTFTYNELEWYVDKTAPRATFQEAQKSCHGLNDENNTTQWRLPNIKELESLTSLQNAYVAQQEVPVSLENEFYWSSTQYRDINYSKLVLNFATGNNFWRLDDDKANTMCVHGKEKYLYEEEKQYKIVTSTDKFEHFVNHDLNLTWHQAKDDTELVFRDAQKYCEDLPYYKGVLNGWDADGTAKQDLVEHRPVVYFDLDIDKLSPREQSKLEFVAQQLPADQNITLYCHTDRKQSEAYNQDLSKRRCENTANMLEALGIEKDRMILVPLGESQPLIATEDEQVEPRNRRVELDFSLAKETRAAEAPWRLPTMEELRSLVYIEDNATYFNAPNIEKYRNYWSSTPTHYEKYKYWTMEILNKQGLDYAKNEWEKSDVLCVH